MKKRIIIIMLALLAGCSSMEVPEGNEDNAQDSTLWDCGC